MKHFNFRLAVINVCPVLVSSELLLSTHLPTSEGWTAELTVGLWQNGSDDLEGRDYMLFFQELLLSLLVNKSTENQLQSIVDFGRTKEPRKFLMMFPERWIS